MPILQIIGEYDHLIPAAASKPFNDVVGTDDVEIIEYPTGHIGLSVSGSSHKDVWPEVCDWFHDRSDGDDELDEEAAAEIEIGDETDDPADGEESSSSGEVIDAEEANQVDGENADEQATLTGDGAADVESVDGIGPTYAERLRDAGIETTTELADADAATVAEVAEVSESRAQDWLDQLA